MSNPDAQEDITELNDSIDVENDPNYRDFIESKPVPGMAELRAKLESVWSDNNDH